jgi:hypothetical protein
VSTCISCSDLCSCMSAMLCCLGWHLTLILLTWSIGWAPNNASKWQMGFNSAFKGLTLKCRVKSLVYFYLSPVLRQLSPSSGTQTPFLSV